MKIREIFAYSHHSSFAMKYATFLSRILPRNEVYQSKRFFLSQAFECTQVWNSRLSNPLVAKVEPEAMYYELNGIFNRTRKMNAIDFDLFVNAQTDHKLLTEVEELAYKFRQTADTCSTLPTTHHAFVRLFVDSPHKMEDFVRILQDRVNYGIFPDNYCTIYLLNKMLKREDYRNAARIASLKMFQEDFTDDLVTLLSLYSLLKYLPTNEPWNGSNAVQPEENEDEEPIMVKVRILRNPFFDDHFDLTDGQHICGKTLAMIGSRMMGEIADSAKIMGWALYNKWDKLTDLLNEIARTNRKVYAESVQLAESVVKAKLSDTEKAEIISKLLGEIDEGRLIAGSMADSVQKLIEEEVARSENDRIETQEKLYKEWENLRKERLEAYLEEMTKRKRLEDVERMKVELQHREELLYFFDKEDEIEVGIEKKEDLRRKREYIEKVEVNENDYVPPETHQRQNR